VIENPPRWVDRAIKSNWDAIKSMGLPLPVGGRLAGQTEELGCGHYGCVLETEDETIVFKLTSDPTEGEFIKLAGPLGWPEGIVQYHGIIRLDFTYRNRPVYALWREAANEVGNIWNYGRDDDYESRARNEFIANLLRFKDHAARFRDSLKRNSSLWGKAKRMEQWAWDTISLQDAEGERAWSSTWDRHPTLRDYPLDHLRGAERVAASWRACEIIAEQMASTYLSDKVGAAFAFYMDNGFLLADVHTGNIGRVWRDGSEPWVITDPGHVVVL